VVRLLTEGATLMLQHGQAHEGVELAQLLLEHYKAAAVVPSVDSLAPLLRIFNAFADTTPPELRRSFVKASITWSARPDNHEQGAPELHDAYASFYARVGERALAERHYVRGSGALVAEHARLLTVWAAEGGYAGEEDLFVARSVLQLLCLSNLKGATALLSTALQQRPLDSPLIHFLRFVVQVVQHDAYPLFDKLRQQYAPSIARDPTFEKLLELVAKVYFNVEPPQSRGGGMAGLLGGMMRSFLGGGDE